MSIIICFWTRKSLLRKACKIYWWTMETEGGFWAVSLAWSPNNFRPSRGDRGFESNLGGTAQRPYPWKCCSQL